MRHQFLAHHLSWVARDKLKDLRQIGSIRDYMKTFSLLLLDIEGMSVEDKLFNFVNSLKPWAQNELCKQKVSNLPSAITVAEALVDFKPPIREAEE